MEYFDCAPVAVPTLAEQRDALQKGLGRARLWAQQGLLADAPLLEACLQDLRYDKQCEEPRGDWLWELIKEIDAKEQFRVPILHALYAETDGWNASQLYELAGHYAAEGDETFRAQLYEVVKQKPFEDNRSLGEEEIMNLDDKQGFQFAAQIRGTRLKTIEWDWDDEYLVNNAMKDFGEEEILNLMSSATDVNLRRFYDLWIQNKKPDPPSQNPKNKNGKGNYIKRMQAIPVDEIIQAANGAEHCHWFRGWGMYADEASLNTVLNALRSINTPSILVKLIKVFSNRALPVFDPRLIELCQHHDDELQRWAFSALANNSHPAIREFALEQLTEEWSLHVFSLFINNYKPGDEAHLFAALELPEDSWEIHCLFSDLLKVLEHNPGADRSPLAEMIYRLNPCELCRFKAVQLLKEQNIAPAWMIEECRFDTYEDTRMLFNE
ncbi:hypothetical protein Pan241w_42250 [Gimesia alba]|uniref:Uncharacterized protein n=1 Tax=Gimesia alba TaxID=2527973 RepID=A0A517RJT7_9PLAN|nr:hypothetical protein [Gimesia alba]QDT44119.1 hypothetical protein Pan241w_42250 [Gimesia alba]